MCNYLDFHQDIVQIQNELNASKSNQKEVIFEDIADVGTKVMNVLFDDSYTRSILYKRFSRWQDTHRFNIITWMNHVVGTDRTFFVLLSLATVNSLL